MAIIVSVSGITMTPTPVAIQPGTDRAVRDDGRAGGSTEGAA